MFSDLTLWLLPVGLTALLLLAMLYRKIYHVNGQTAEQILPSLSPLGAMGVHDLFSRSAENHLRMNLPPQQFRCAQRHRIRMALEYIHRISQNAVALQQWATHELVRARALRTPDCSRLSMKLVAATIHCRIYSFALRVRLSCCLLAVSLLPFLSPPSFDALVKLGNVDLISFYARVRAAARDLGRYYDEGQETRVADLL